MNAMTTSKKVFISYDHADTATAHRIASDLERNGIEVWIAPESILPGESWVEAINRGLNECSFVITVLTQSALHSDWVRMETNAAIALERKGKLRLIPLELSPCQLPPLWASYQMISFNPDYETALKSLTRAINVGPDSCTPEHRREGETTTPHQHPESGASAVSAAHCAAMKAELHMLKSNEGGRKAPCFSGYTPTVDLGDGDMKAFVTLPADAEMLTAGQTMVVTVTLPRPVLIAVRTRFDVRDGDRIVGKGVVTELLA